MKMMVVILVGIMVAATKFYIIVMVYTTDSFYQCVNLQNNYVG
jgi:hypothetical protein